MRVSIVIPTFNRAGMFAHTIPALLKQQAGDFTYEVIFVANGSSDATDSILKGVVASHPETFRYFWIEPTGGPSAPRNVGIRAATGDVVIILDDDVAPDPDLVLRHVEFHRQHAEPHQAAVGQVYVPPHMLEDPMSIFHSHYSYDRLRNAELLTYFDFWTCNVSLKREFMLSRGMFNEHVPYFEDIEVAHRLEKAGMHLYFVPLAQGQHLHQSTPAKLADRAFAIGGGLYRVMEHMPAASVKKRFGLVSTEFGPKWFVKRLLRLVAFFLIDNPATRGLLRLLGATGRKRNRVTDAYYSLVFGRSFLAGYYKTWFKNRRLPAMARASQT